MAEGEGSSARMPFEWPAPGVAPRDSATLIVVRDGAAGPEVFMLERHLRSDFAGGAYVFPGGTVDERDCDPRLAEVTDGLPPGAADLYGAAPERALGFPICAIRETFEEAGILLARDAAGRTVRFDGANAGRFAEARRALAAGETTPLELAREFGLRFAADLLVYYQRWVTPEFAPRRYDARFFVAPLPEGQDPIHDEVETTASAWVAPTEALERARAGSLSIIFPTRKTLESLREHRSADEVLAAARARTEFPAVLPRIVLRDGEPRILLPGDDTEHEP